jgi:hypothetical protein
MEMVFADGFLDNDMSTAVKAKLQVRVVPIYSGKDSQSIFDSDHNDIQ